MIAWPRWSDVAAQKIWPVPDAVVTVLCTPDDECGWHPKHVEWTCRVINRLLCVACCWTVINIYSRHFPLYCFALQNKLEQFVPFWVIPRRLSSNCRRFGTHYRFHIHRQVNEVCQWHWHTSFTCLWRWNRLWVPKLRQLELRRRELPKKEQITFRTRR